MKVSTNRWHYRVNKWAWGTVPNNLCPYVDKLVLGIVLAPLIALWRVVTELGKAIMIAEAFAIAYSLPLFFLLRWPGILVGHLFGFGLFGLLIGSLRLADYVDEHGWHFPKLFKERTKKEKPPKPEKVKKPKEPSIITEWLKAKHRRICPFLEFVEEQ